MNTLPKKIVMIGAGNLAHHLAALFIKKGHEIIQVVSRTENSAKAFGQKHFTTHITDLKKINQNADIYIVCVNDDEIEKVAAALKLKDKLVIHTSGSIDSKVLQKASTKYGVIYPLQTFTRNAKVKWGKIPLLIEGNSVATQNQIKAFAISLCKEIHILKSEERLKLHLAAVFACNFSNHLYALSKEFLTQEKINHFELLKPLILQTAKKIKKTDPAEAQTGPAIRGDKHVIEKHLKLLDKYKNHREIYSLLTKSIIDSTTKRSK